jgi:predicted metal-dependent hydrolase
MEVVDRTMILGFYDDVAIRVTGDANDARIDVRSASRYGTHDLGRNAERTRRILKEIITRLESVVPTRKEKVAETTAKEKPKVKKRRRRSRRWRRRRRR